MTAPQRLGTQLFLITLGGLALIAGVVALTVPRSLSSIERAVSGAAQSHAYQRLGNIRDQLLKTGQPDRAVTAQWVQGLSEWLQPLLNKSVEGEEYLYAMLVSPTGEILAHSDPRLVGEVLPESVMGQVAPKPEESQHAAHLRSWSGGDHLVDFAVPIDLPSGRLASVHVGVSQPALAEIVANRRDEIAFPIWVGVGLSAFIVAAVAFGAWWHVRRARQWDRHKARQEHLASVGTLARGLVHEIRNPLNAMRMQIAVIRSKLAKMDGSDAQLATAQLQRLEEEVLRLQNIATEFLTFGRPPVDKPEEFEVAKLMQETADFLGAEFQQHHIAIEVQIEPRARASAVVMDRAKLRQVLLNLASNAEDAMPQGGTLRLGLGLTSGRRVSLTVSDTGCGIRSDRVAHVFDAFYSTKDEGNGLGLAIVKQVLEGAGGDIGVRSALGEGTEFRITLPLAPGPSRHFEPQTEASGRLAEVPA